jgi:hypothetical protein
MSSAKSTEPEFAGRRSLTAKKNDVTAERALFDGLRLGEPEAAPPPPLSLAMSKNTQCVIDPCFRGCWHIGMIRECRSSVHRPSVPCSSPVSSRVEDGLHLIKRIAER